MPDDGIANAFRSAMRLDANFPLQDTMSFDDVPGWDSIGHMSLVTELETRFGIALDMDEIVVIDSVGSVRELVARKQAATR
jgi:acyl carrier protein